jgi:hypothetical protein
MPPRRYRSWQAPAGCHSENAGGLIPPLAYLHRWRPLSVLPLYGGFGQMAAIGVLPEQPRRGP